MADHKQPDYTQPDYVDRRVRYFDGQFLHEQDFIDEQRYHLDRQRRLARLVSTPGIVEGLAVTPVANAAKVTVAAGTALDARGRLLVRVDAGDPLDLSDLANRDGPVNVLVALTYAEVEADAPQGGGSPRWRETPALVVFLDGATDAPPADAAPRLARVVLRDGTAAVDREWVPLRSGVTVRGPFTAEEVAAFPGGVTGAATDEQGTPPLEVRNGLQVTGPVGSDSTARLDVTDGSADHGHATVVVTGRFQQGDDAWRFGTTARNSIVFARNAADSGQHIGAVGEEQVSLQLEGNSRALGFLTRDRGTDPALVLTQDGKVGVGTDQPGATLDVAGELAARGAVTVGGGLAMGEVGRWTAEVEPGGSIILIRIAPGSPRNYIVLKRRAGHIPTVFVVPPSDRQNWFGWFTCYDPGELAGAEAFVGAPVVLRPTVIGGERGLFGTSNDVSMPVGTSPMGLILQVHLVTVLDG